MLEGNFENDKLNGPVTIYHRNGNLKARVNYKNGLMHENPYRELYDTGELHLEGAIIVGKQEGLFKEYFKNGAIKRQGIYKNDLPDGVFTNFSELGYKRSEDFYDKGRLLNHKEFDPSGKIKSEKFYYWTSPGFSPISLTYSN